MTVRKSIKMLKSFFCAFFIFSLVYEQLVTNVQAIQVRIDKKNMVNPAREISPLRSHFFSHNNKLYRSPLTKLPVLSNGQTALPSNATNFHGAWNASVDSRTGSPSFSLTVASFLYDYGQKRHNLILSYSGGNSATGPDPFDLGPHWHWNIATERPSATEIAGHKTTDIITSDGHTLTMETVRDSTGQTVWKPLRHKMGDVIITGFPGNWTITLSTGIREHIKNGYEDWEEGQDGHKVWFYYDKNGSARDEKRHLICISPNRFMESLFKTGEVNCGKNSLPVSYQGNMVVVHGKQKVTLYSGMSDTIRQVQKISLPSLSSENISNSQQEAMIAFTYDTENNLPWLLRKVTYPVGSDVVFLYNNEADKNEVRTPGIPVGISGARLPVVTEEIIHSSHAGARDKKIWYHYGINHHDEHNYTGYQGNAVTIPGKDNLMDREDSYLYRVSQDDGMTTTTTTYNKYHLPLSVVRRDDQYKNILNSSESIYPEWRHKTFAELPGNYSLPVKSVNTLYSLSENGDSPTGRPLKTGESRLYDNNGEIIWRRDAWGREIFTEYCPAMGDSHCPVMEGGWPETSFPEKVLIRPPPGRASQSAENLAGDKSSQVTEIVFDYKKMRSVSADNTPVTLKKNITVKKQVTSASHFWQVGKKIVGIVPENRAYGLNPGDKIPDLQQNEALTETRYTYDEDEKSLTYGQVKQLTLLKYKKPETQKSSYPGMGLSTTPLSAQSITLNVTHTINTALGTRTTTMAVAPEAMSYKQKKSNAFLSIGSFELGTSVYSIKSGIKLSAHDTMKTLNVSWKYDLWNRPVEKIVTPTNEGNPRTTRWAYIFTKDENAVVETDPYGNQYKTVFNEEGNPVSFWHRFKNHTDFTMEGKSNWIQDNKITYTYAGKPSSKTVWISDSRQPNKSVALKTTYGYDSLNRKIWEKHPDGVVDVTVHDDESMRVIHYRVTTMNGGRDKAPGPLLTVIDSNILGKPDAVYVFSFSPQAGKNGKSLYSSSLKERLGILKKDITQMKALPVLSGYGYIPLAGTRGLFAFVRDVVNEKKWLTYTRYVYDRIGHRIQQTTGDNITTRWHWKHGNLVSTTLPDGREIYDRHDIQGNTISRCVKSVGSCTCHLLGSRGYDNMGNMIWQTDEAGRTVRYTYDGDGRKLSMTMPALEKGKKGHVVSWRYSSLGLVEKDLDGKPYEKFTYNPSTWQLTDKEDSVSHIHYDYDSNTGQLVKITHTAPVFFHSPAGFRYPEGTEIFTYDQYNQPLEYKDRFGNWFYSVRDSVGRVIQTRVRLPSQSGSVTLTATTYDGFGRPEIISNGIGIKRRFSYDVMGRVSDIEDSAGSEVINKMSYTYNLDTGNIMSLTRKEGGLSATQAYKYDVSNNLVSMRCGKTGAMEEGSLLCPREVDLEGSHFKSPLIILAQKYSFDRWNNIKTVHEALVDVHGQKRFKDVRYWYSGEQSETGLAGVYDPNQMTGLMVNWSGENRNSTPKKITYDALGRMIKDTAGNRLHYNAFGNMDRFINVSSGETTHYTYSSEGFQASIQPFDKKNSPLQPPLYLIHKGNRISAQVQKDFNGHTHVSADLNGTARSEDGAIKTWYLHDYKGDVLTTFNSQGMRTSDNVYSPYGMSYNLQGQKNQSFPESLIVANQNLWWKQRQPGFNGEITDPATGYQFLGGGYRAYNPVYRHFMSRDSFAPFKKINGYGFVDNNPVMNTDPGGHMPEWAGYLMSALSLPFALIGTLTGPVAAIAAGAGALTIGCTTVASVVTGLISMASGSLQIAAQAKPNNMNLQQASGVLSMTTGALGFITSIVGGIEGLAMPQVIFMHGKISNIFKTTMLFRKVLKSLLVISAVSNTISAATGTASNVMGFAVLNDEGLDGKNYDEAIKVLDYISIGFMVTSLVTGYMSKFLLKSRAYIEGKTKAYDAVNMFGSRANIAESSQKRSVFLFRTIMKGVTVGLVKQANEVIDGLEETPMHLWRRIGALSLSHGASLGIDRHVVHHHHVFSTIASNHLLSGFSHSFSNFKLKSEKPDTNNNDLSNLSYDGQTEPDESHNLIRNWQGIF